MHILLACFKRRENGLRDFWLIEKMFSPFFFAHFVKYLRLAYWQIILTAKIVVLRSSFTDYRFRVFVGEMSQRLFLRVISFDDARILNAKKSTYTTFFRIDFSPDDILMCKLGKRNIGRWIRINQAKTISSRKLISDQKRNSSRFLYYWSVMRIKFICFGIVWIVSRWK